MNNLKKRLVAAAAATAISAGMLVSTPAFATPVAPPSRILPAGTSHPCFASPVYDTRGPGLKNWRAIDPWCDGGGNPGRWYGPWRYTKSGALIDAETHNQFML